MRLQLPGLVSRLHTYHILSRKTIPRLRCAGGRSFAMAWVLAWAAVEAASGHGGYHDVVTAISAELHAQPGDTALRYKLAEAHASHDEWQDCLKEIKLIERLAPGVYPTGYLQGLALHIAGKDEEAKTALDEFLAVNPDHVDALATRGRVLMKLGFPQAAVADFQKVVKLTKSPNSTLIADLALALRDSGNPVEASRAIDEGLKTAGDAPSLLLCALEIETTSAAWDAALSRIDALQKTAPCPEPWMAERAAILLKAGRADEARIAWTALRDQLLSLPNLERGSPQNQQLLQRSFQALGEAAPAPVVAPPAAGRP